jgi:Family of unknown function (DUF6367)
MAHVVLSCNRYQIGDWKIRIDKPHGNQPYHRRHVHIKKKGLDGQYSWNQDGSRHDKRKFPRSEQCIAAAKRHAAEALGVNVGDLSFISSVGGGVRVSVYDTLALDDRSQEVFSSYIRRDRAVVFFGSEGGLVIVVESSDTGLTDG